MTPQERTAIASALMSLSDMRSCPADLSTYIDQLETVDPDHLRLACTRILRSQDWFPSLHELLVALDHTRPRVETQVAPRVEDLEEAHTEVIRYPMRDLKTGVVTYTDLAVTVTQEHYYDCAACRDTGWREVPGKVADYCYVLPCPCRPTNPTLRRKREAQERYAREKVTR